MAVERKKEKKEKKEKERKRRGKNRWVFQRVGLCIFAPFHSIFLGQSLVESKDRLSIKDLGLDLKIWQEHINV